MISRRQVARPRTLPLGLALLLAGSASWTGLCAQGAKVPTPRAAAGRAPVLRTPTALLQRGAYDQAIRAVEQLTDTTPASIVVLVRALTELGRPREAVERSASWPAQPEVAAARAVALEAVGRLDQADQSWGTAMRGADSLYARVERLRLARDRGADSAMERLDALVATITARGGARTASEFHALALAARLLGSIESQRVRDALRWYDRALALDSSRNDARVELGELFLDRFNYADARATLQQALARNPRHPRGLAALTRLNALDGGATARDPLGELLAVNPSSADGRALAARRLVDAERYDDAVVEARKGLVNDSGAPGPWVVIAAARWLANDTAGHQAALADAHRRLPGSAAAEVALADVSARNRLYTDAVRFARAGVARDARNARALALLGINLLRVGQVAEARTTLDRAFALDPFDVWAKNTLDLLDSYASARTVATPHFDLVIEPGDAELLALYAAPLAEEAYRTLTTRYGFEPTERVRVEFFRSHADFSVRAVGLAGLGALGVAFGNVLALDAPPARARGEFNVGAVLWHEFTHTITLGMTENRVPRWVSEGLSVYEERRARREWGGGATPMLIAAYGAGRLQPVSRLNDGFVHPRFEQEVILSYALSAFVFEMLEERKGMAGIRALLDGYRRGGATPALMQQVYGLDAVALDTTFDRWFRAKHVGAFAAVQGTVRAGANGETQMELTGPLPEALRAATAARKREQWPQVVEAAQQAVALFPAHVEPGSGYHLLAEAYSATGRRAEAATALAAIVTRNGEAFEENMILAGLLEAAADSTGAIAALSRAAAIDPFDRALHGRLASLASARRDWPTAILARRAELALAPTDRADALYRLALALAAAGDRSAARREVLRALDLAPGFEAAQDLLLSIRSTGKVP
jgi:tetratricopeptide (TPR) repeat protein